MPSFVAPLTSHGFRTELRAAVISTLDSGMYTADGGQGSVGLRAALLPLPSSDGSRLQMLMDQELPAVLVGVSGGEPVPFADQREQTNYTIEVWGVDGSASLVTAEDNALRLVDEARDQVLTDIKEKSQTFIASGQVFLLSGGAAEPTTDIEGEFIIAKASLLVGVIWSRGIAL